TAFRRAGKALGDSADVDMPGLAAALEAALAGVQQLGAAREGDKTMVDALAPATGAFSKAIAEGASDADALAALAEAAQAGAAAREGAAAAAAVERSAAAQAAALAALANPDLAARADDVRQVGNAVLARLAGGAPAPPPAGNFILVQRDVDPVDLIRFADSGL